MRAYRNGTRLERRLGELGHGVVVLDAEGRARFATARARRWIEEYFGRHLGLPGPLPEPLDLWVQQRRAGAGSADNPPSRREPLIVEREGKRLEVRLRSEAEETELLLEEQPTAMRREPLQALGLTRREAEVLAWVAQGKTNSQIAIILGTRPKTIGKHLERIFRKLMVETRTAAVAVAVEAVRRAPPVR